ncbi:transcriptional repressor TCF25-domain-containing protein [Xylariaceae sp. FL0662B]|nr:transcriptional repressor TCF25-domain-containing protein [Xylariaceae sp. FL0662B]
MSTRQLRKLQKQRELEELQRRNLAHDSESSEDDQPLQKPKTSIFSSLATVEFADDEDNKSDEKEDEPVAAAREPIDEPDRTTTPRSSSKKSKKKKKKAKKQEATPTKVAKPVGAGSDDSIDQALRELELLKTSTTAHASEDDTSVLRTYERICKLLSVNSYHLKVINEMRNLFGREAIVAAQNEENEEQGRSRRQRQPLYQQVDLETFLKGQPGKALPEVTLRRNPFLLGKETWPRASTDGLTMKEIKDGTVTSKAGTIEFGFAHDQFYNNLETQFFALVQMFDPMQLVQFLHRHPYHISSLIQVSKVAKQDQNSALSADLCERALFTFGRVSLAAFRQKIEEGKARLEFRRPENRQFWLAGYHYLKSLIMKGTYRTALEWSKLLFSMDLSDPYGLIHFIHPLAIRAHESKWLIDFCDSGVLDECNTAQDYIRQTLILARLQQDDVAGAKTLLIEGLESLPWLYSSLFKSLNLDVPKAIWGMQPRNPNEELYVELYINQTKGLWNNAQATSLLKEVAKDAKKSASKPVPFPPVVRDNVGRFVYLDNTPSLMSLAPSGMLSRSPNWEFDPLPPALEDNIISYESQKLPWKPNRAAQATSSLAGNPQALRRILDRARQEGAPADIQRIFQDAIADAEGDEGGNDDDDDDDNDDEDDEDGGEDEDGIRGLVEGGGLGAVFQAFMDLINPGTRHGNLDDFDFSAFEEPLDMPGVWVEDDDLDNDDDPDNETDDEMPPLEPAP